MPTEQKLWTREYVIVIAVNLFISLNFFASLNAMPIYTMDVFSMSETEAGIVVGIFPAGILVSRFIAGRLADIIGFKRLLVISTILLLITTLGYFIAVVPTALYFVRFFSGFFFGLAANTNLTIAANIMPRSRSGEGIGYYSLGQVVALAIGPFFAVYLSLAGNYNILFALCVAFAGIALIIIPFIKVPEKKNESAPASEESKKNFINLFVEPKVIPIAILAFLLFSSFAGINAFVPAFAETIDLSKVAVYYFPLYAIVILVTRPFVSKLYDKKGANIVLFPAMIFFAIGAYVCSQVNSEYQLILAAILMGLGFGAFSSSLLASVVDLIPLNRMSVANATYFMFVDTAAAAGPMFAGALIPLFGYRGMFVTILIVAILCIPLYFIVHGKKHG